MMTLKHIVVRNVSMLTTGRTSGANHTSLDTVGKLHASFGIETGKSKSTGKDVN